MNSAVQTEPQPSTIKAESSSSKRSLPLLDWVLLPLLAVLTIVLLAGSTEWFAHHHFSESKSTTLACLNISDPHLGVSAHPNSVCSQKMKESKLVEFRFNECGHRTNLPCSPAPEGTFRIVLIGSSLAEGMWVPQPETFAALLPAKLSAMTGRKLDLYNEAMQWETPRNAASRMDEILAAKPSMVIWQLGPFDVENATLKLPFVPGKQKEDDGSKATAPVAGPRPTGLIQRVDAAEKKYNSPAELVSAAWTRLIDPLNQTDTVFLAKHYIYKSQSQFLKQYLANSTSSGFLRKQTPADVEAQLQNLDSYVDQVSTRLNAAGISLVIVFLPNRAQMDMVASGSWPSNDDPYRLEEEVKQIANQHGAKFVEVLHDFITVSDPDRFYFPVDGHLTPEGHSVVTDLLAKELTSGAVPALSASQAAESAKEGAR